MVCSDDRNMKNSSNGFADPMRSSDPSGTVSRLREEWRVARAAHAELVHLGMPRVNMLLTGPDGVIEYLLDALLPDMREPIGRWCPGDRLLLPPPALVGTMVFQDIGAMPSSDQRQLLEWLTDAAGRTQVISITRAKLVRLVEAGQFIEDLYYRLNIVSIDATV
jgi:Sigma-54 interaction domain